MLPPALPTTLPTSLGERIVEVLKQKRNSPVSPGGQVAIIYAVINGYLNSIPVSKIPEYEERLYDKLDREAKDWQKRIEDNHFEEEDIERLKQILDEMK